MAKDPSVEDEDSGPGLAGGSDGPISPAKLSSRPDAAGSDPGPTASPELPQRWDGRFHTVIVVMILVTAGLGALTIWWATVIGGRASVLDQSSTLELVQFETLLTQDQQLVANDIGLLAPYQEATMSKVLLIKQAQHNRDLAPELRGNAETEHGIATQLASAFNVAPTKADDGTVTYPAANCPNSWPAPRASKPAANACETLIDQAQLFTPEDDPTLYEPHNEILLEEADGLRNRSIHLVMTSALLAMALVLFTLAQLPRGAARVRVAGLGFVTLLLAGFLALFFGLGW